MPSTQASLSPYADRRQRRKVSTKSYAEGSECEYDEAQVGPFSDHRGLSMQFKRRWAEL